MTDDAASRRDEDRDLEELLAREQEERKRVLEEVSRHRATPAEDELIDSFRAITRGTVAAAGASDGPAVLVRPFWSRPTLLAAAGILIAVSAWSIGRFGGESDRPAGDDERIRLGSSVRCSSPIGTVDVIEEFHWQGELPAGGYFELIVYDGESGRELFRATELEQPSYRITDAERRAIDGRLRWRVVMKDVAGSELGFDEKRAERR